VYSAARGAAEYTGRLLVCYGASEHNACMLAGVDKEEYRETIRPRLMSRGLLEVRPYYGQALTDRAVALYRCLGGACVLSTSSRSTSP
jgi:hypothetical protein